MTKVKVLQATSVVSKTVQTLIGEVIDTSFYDYLTLFFEYNKGDETAIVLKAFVMSTDTLDVTQDQSWTAAAGTKTHTLNEYTPADGVPHYLTFDVRGIPFMKFTQNGTSNDGTPTGTLAATYALK